MDPGTYISIAQVAFQGACYAVKTFRKGLHFNQDAERLVLALEVERFRLSVWGENAGLAPQDGQPANLSGRLVPIAGILKEYLEQIEGLVNDAGGLSTRYGLLQTEQAPTKSELVRQLVGRMQRSIKVSGIKATSSIDIEDDDEDENAVQDALESLRVTDKPSTWRKARWAVRDLDKFDGLVKDLAQRITKLNDLLTETQQRRTREDNYRVNMVVIGSAVDEASLELIRAAVRDDPDTSQVRAAVERKALSVADAVSEKPVSRRPVPLAVPSLSLDDFVLPSNFATLDRFIAAKVSDPGVYFFLERKPYNQDTLPRDMELLTRRVNLLVNLLRRPKSDDFRTPLAEGCIKDPTNFCWWIVFQYPVTLPRESESPSPPPSPSSPSSTPPSSAPPRTALRPRRQHRRHPLRALPLWLASQEHPQRQHPLPRRPPDTTNRPCPPSALRPAYIAFHLLLDLVPLRHHPFGATPIPTPLTRTTLASPLVANFSYTRHETEQVTIDRARTMALAVNPNAAATEDVSLRLPNIYRHPAYQGPAAQGYRLGYDIYSFGLVLMEIALWVPLGTFLDGVPNSSSRRKDGEGEGQKKAGILSRDMPEFYGPHANELRRRVLTRVEGELGFRVGSAYCDVVRWCLEYAAEEEDGGEGAMEFYNRVVVPLGGLV
ncbi:prion-inhibition and propagation-domain-containing protein [Schizothecium vesticola]|uniref:Prion-inhibition and propagation-domain-containing protein n=1 Tax=Schizothecium vesticola TaxID=314040 RepID=A0AA40F3W4_9PEZI|nr:prion-inhibition and propagation-domain-containing protein [Schizothecium vesticola]